LTPDEIDKLKKAGKLTDEQAEIAEKAYQKGLTDLTKETADDGLTVTRRINVGPSGHHVPAVRKCKGRPDLEVKRSDKSRPTLFSKGDDPGHDHWRMHNAEREFVGPRQGAFEGTDDDLFDAYREAYKDLDDIEVEVRSPDGSVYLGSGTPREAVDLLDNYLRGGKGK